MSQWMIESALVTFIWLLPYGLGASFFWPSQIMVFVISLYFLYKVFSRSSYRIDKKKRIYVWLFLFGISTVVSSVVNFKVADIVMQLIFTVNIMGMFAYFEVACKKNIKATFTGSILILVYCFFMDIIKLRQVGVEDVWHSYTYYTGGKFDVAYNLIMILFMAGILLYRKKPKIRNYAVYILMIIVAVSSCFAFNCMTGFLGILGGLISFMLIKKNMNIMNEKFVFSIFLGAGLIVLFIGGILSLQFVQNVIINILGRTTHLTGRMNIYTRMMNIVMDSVIVGHGRSTIYAINQIGYSNLQNGIWQIIYRFGMLGFIFFSKIIYEWVKTMLQMEDKYKTITIAFFLAFVACSISEITYDYTEFYFFLAMGYGLCKRNMLNVNS